MVSGLEQAHDQSLVSLNAGGPLDEMEHNQFTVSRVTWIPLVITP